MGNCCSPALSKEALAFDVDKDGVISKKELQAYIDKNAQLWAMLSVNCNIPEERCREIAVTVAYQMAKAKAIRKSIKSMTTSEREREPTVAEFQNLLNLLQQPKGNLEFFHRTVFTAFDANQNGYLEPDELDAFLNVYYEAGSIFAGDVRLPSKDQLKRNVLQEFDKDGDGQIDFAELQLLLAAGGNAVAARPEQVLQGQ
uniref:EF-hand domain-containing protein n=1 Tax=Entomoneis paludosa TaxID=265537 RepID=A0A7S3DMY4_9STRA|mmetsp:Transcript_22157/g.46215  ORF Transcript_22157/g.46215 Transcript_22157/m.46215 type:complete len:200 (+) Transcript_22157:239-838(+)|eukprot:CAMPEP_0172445914 /NCGR_PEP_ID=MMETSP1065-20121228/5671_1 /TAXON_ID=265537 /ORGANISM="Amphiprora paludosa, Strain CCMP125" /LENGTH=199 /DNA_ID=CAMNT_0013196927 /DNA_START=226 /DNA_END=828 /DNA_ORIENTATION=-